MPALPAATAFTDADRTEGQFKTAITDQRGFLAAVLGTDGLIATARTTLGVGTGDTPTFNGLNITGNTTLGDASGDNVTLNGNAVTLANNTTTFNRQTNASAKAALKNADTTNSSSRALVSAETSAITVALQARHGDMGYVGSVTNTKVAFAVNDTAQGAMDTSGNLLWGKTSTSFSVAGVELKAVGTVDITVNGGRCIELNRLTSDGSLVDLYRDGSLVGNISVAAGVVSYNAFMGSHYTQLSGGGRAEILRGTVMQTVDEMCEWEGVADARLPRVKVSDTPGTTRGYGVMVAFDDPDVHLVPVMEEVPEPFEETVFVDGKWRVMKGERTARRQVFEEHNVYDEAGNPVMVKVRDEEWENVREDVFQRVMVPQDDGTLRERLIQVDSIVTGTRRVREAEFAQLKHRVPVMEERPGSDDFLVAGLGAGEIRMQAGQVVHGGELVESAGDGTARVQADDVVRASTLARVTAAVVTTTYPDGSFLVPCVLMCG